MARFEFRLAIVVLVVLAMLALFPTAFSGFDPWNTGASALSPPSSTHPLGSDALGRDTWSRVVHSARTSLLVGLLATSVALVIGGAVGLAAGTLGGWIDEGLMRVTELLDAFPALLLALFLVALWGPGLMQISFAIGISGWSGVARVLRVGIVTTREEGFVVAAKAMGASPMRVAFHHLLPHALAPLWVLLPFRIEAAIIAEASLSFLGFGDLAYPSWGGMLRDAQPFLRDAWWLVVGPGILLLLTVFALSLLADCVQQKNNPLLNRRNSKRAQTSPTQTPPVIID